jgi:hypothetical protein
VLIVAILGVIAAIIGVIAAIIGRKKLLEHDYTQIAGFARYIGVALLGVAALLTLLCFTE